MRIKKYAIYLVLMINTFLFLTSTYGQGNYREIALPTSISGVNEEFSGMTIWKNRLYLLPQYGDHKETKLDGDFFIYTIRCDSIGRVIDGKDSGLTACRSIKVNNLQKLPDSIKKYYEGFEAITIIDGKVFLSIETDDEYDSCYILKGKLDINKNEISIDPVIYAALKRYPYIENAGFESVTYLPRKNRILALYEYNGMPGGGVGFLLDTSLRRPFKKINTPFLHFRLTDIKARGDGKIFAINYFWGGDYNDYLNNNIQRHEEDHIKSLIPDLKNNLNSDPGYLKKKSTCYSRIVMLNNYTNAKWKQVASFECKKNNWEGLALFKKGALIISDANRSSSQVTTLAYVNF